MLVLSHYLHLDEKLSELPEVEKIADHGETIRAALCELFLSECGDALKYEIFQEVLDTDEITDLLINFRENVSFSAAALQEHTTETVHNEVEKDLDDMLNQIVRSRKS
tara:strand:+ start:134 stop:457 length:324 start_codon:yes stop_codon:yes gene_type:complete